MKNKPNEFQMTILFYLLEVLAWQKTNLRAIMFLHAEVKGFGAEHAEELEKIYSQDATSQSEAAFRAILPLVFGENSNSISVSDIVNSYDQLQDKSVEGVLQWISQHTSNDNKSEASE